MIVPKLRFSEFKDEWNEKLLSDFTTFSKGKGLSKSDIVKNGKNPCIRYGELYTTYGSTISEAISYTNLDKNNCVLSKKNQIIIPSSGETQIDIATASCVLSDDIILGGDLNILTTNENGIFLAYYLSSAKKNDIAQLAQGNSVVHLYAKELATLKINYPSKEEQTKIAEFLSTVDNKISQLSRQLELLNQYKKGVMQKIFSQEIRFKNDNGEDFGEWEEVPLNQIASKVTVKNRGNKVTEVLTNSATQGIIKQSDFFDREIVSESNINGYYVVEVDDFVYNLELTHYPKKA
jgi:type I restriction enzyme S subunit